MAALALTGVIFAVLGVITGVGGPTPLDQHAFVANVLIAPLALVAAVFYRAERLTDPWRTLTRLDPIYYLVDATRHGYTGLHGAALGVAAVLAAGQFLLAAVLLQRGWGLKT